MAILSAVLQYCSDPNKEAKESSRVMKFSGYVYVNAPFVQPYCYDMQDMFRFTKGGLLFIFEKYFRVLEYDVNIPGASSLAFFCQALVGITRTKI